MTPKVQVGTISDLGAAPDRPGSWVGERALLRKLEPRHAMTAAGKSQIMRVYQEIFCDTPASWACRRGGVGIAPA
jgi:hypothetical protein